MEYNKYKVFSSKSKKIAILLSYGSVVIQALATMILTRLYLNELGADAYGLYQMIYAVAQYILILDLGIGAVMIRYISEYEASGDRKKTENFAYHFRIIILAIICAIFIVGVLINKNIEKIYINLSDAEYEIAHDIFRVMIIQMIFTVIAHFYRGLCEAYERFIFVRTISIIQIILNFILVFILVKFNFGIYGIVYANTIVIFFSVLCTFYYAKFIIRFDIRFHGWEIDIFKSILLLMLAMLLQAIVGHVNSSVDKTVLGIMSTKKDVAVYAVAATILTMFNTLPTVVANVFQTGATKLVVKGASREQLTDFVVKPGRVQFMLIGGFIVGFILFGKDFIECWTGKEMINAWEYVLIILIPNAVPLMQNTCLAILNAMDKRIYRSIILIGTTIINILLTIQFIPVLGPIGAPLATGISYIIGHCIIMNIYYKKIIGLNIERMFKGILTKIWIAVLAAFILSVPLTMWKCNGSWIVLLCKSIGFLIVYAMLLYFIGMNKEERKMFRLIRINSKI